MPTWVLYGTAALNLKQCVIGTLKGVEPARHAGVILPLVRRPVRLIQTLRVWNLV